MAVCYQVVIEHWLSGLDISRSDSLHSCLGIKSEPRTLKASGMETYKVSYASSIQIKFSGIGQFESGLSPNLA